MIEEDSDVDNDENGSDQGSGEEEQGSGEEEQGSSDNEEQGSSEDEDNVKVKAEPKTGSQADDDEKNPLDDVTEDNPLEGSVTEDDPPENLFDDDEAEIDENKKKDDAVDPTSTEEAEPTEDDEHTIEPQHENTTEPHEEESTEHPEEVSVQEMDHVEHHESEETNPLAGDHDLNEDPFGSTAAAAAAGDSETPRDSESHPEAGTSVEDLLGETSSGMEAGDKQYKDLIAETQLDNIFN